MHKDGVSSPCLKPGEETPPIILKFQIATGWAQGLQIDQVGRLHALSTYEPQEKEAGGNARFPGR